MAEQFKFDDKAVEAKFKTIAENLSKAEGKEGFNPFLYANQKVQPLIARFKKGERTEALAKEIMALPMNPVPETQPKKVETPVVKSTSGLTMPVKK